ncbi:MAG: TetR/AcrR family transcriptional regulator C-terminal domain-containing protein [Candidatus Dormiibacterota bacterium]
MPILAADREALALLHSDHTGSLDPPLPSPNRRAAAVAQDTARLSPVATQEVGVPAEIRDLLLDDLLNRWHDVLQLAERADNQARGPVTQGMTAAQISARNHLPGRGVPMGRFVREMGIRERTASAGDEPVEEVLAGVASRALTFFRQSMPIGHPQLDEPQWLQRRQQRVAQLGAGPRRPVVLLAAYLRAEQAHGRIRNDADPDAAAALLLGACFHAAFLSAFLDDEPADSDQFARDIAGTLMGGVKARGSASMKPPTVRSAPVESVA